MILPIRTDRPLRSTPYVNYALILINVTVFALQKLSEAGALPIDLRSFALDPGEPKLLHFVSYAFLHGGWMHLIGNMVFLYIFGNNIEDKLGKLSYLAFYLAGGVFAGIGYVVLSSPVAPGGIYVPVVGASGAIATVTGAFLVLFPRTNVTLFYFFIIIGATEVPALLLVPFYFFQDVIFGLVGIGGNVAHSAHISGTVFGLAVSLGLLGLRLLPRDQWDLWALISRWNRRRQYRDAVNKGWNPYGYGAIPEGKGGAFAGPPAPVDPRAQQAMDIRAQVAEAMAHRDLATAADHYLRLKALDPAQVLSRNAQLDIANQLAEMARYAEAADAYERFLHHYPQSEQHAHIELLTGLLYARYLDDPTRAVQRIEHALPRLTAPREVELAKSELGRLRPLVGPRT